MPIWFLHVSSPIGPSLADNNNTEHDNNNDNDNTVSGHNVLTHVKLAKTIISMSFKLPF